ncbi:MAG: RecQ family ATP-dependent DNA helicase [Akkermansia sp.]
MPDLPHDLETALHLFGKTDFRPMQREIMVSVLEGRPCIGVLPTGSGKSLCYQLPAVLLDTLSIIVSPLIALMKDQVDGLIRLGIKAARFDSSLPEEERPAVLTRMRQNELHLVFVAPESITSEPFCEAISGIRLGLFVIDEAHCLSEWGHSFRPDYLGLPDYARAHPFHAVLALTATATQQVVADLANMFHTRPSDIFCLPPTRANIHRQAVEVADEDKIDYLASFLQAPDRTPAIIYARARKDTEEIGAALTQRGLCVKTYHAGMPTETRMLVQNEFFSGKVPILVATIAFGMGIDKADVRSVIHYHPPASPESYVQESGRAGRDGEDSQSLVLMNAMDAIITQNRLHAAIPDKASLDMLLTLLLRPGENVISLYETTGICDLAETALNRILFDLTQDGLLKVTAQGHKYYKLKALYPMATILSGRGEEEKRLLLWLDEHRDGSIEEFAEFSGNDWLTAYAQLQDFALSGEWQVTFRQMARLIHTPPTHPSLKVLVNQYTTKFEHRLEKDLIRLDEIYRILTQSLCINAELDTYFGFDAKLCGHCHPCLTRKSLGTLQRATIEPIDEATREALRTLVTQGKQALSRASQLTRFLIGSPSPAALRSRLWSHSLYGSLARHPWDDLQAEAYALLGK